MISPPRAERSLPEGEVHLWYAALTSAAGGALAEAALGWMNDEERARHDRYRFERNRLEYRVTRGLIRSLLGGYLGVPPGGLRFGATPHGKPFLEAPASDLRFNLSNTEGMVVCLVGRALELGVDVEPLARRVDVRGMAHRFFAPSEVEALMGLPEERHQRRFLAYWTLKEAYIKACGQGLGIPLDHFAYELDEEDRILGIRFATEREDDPGSWQLMQLELGSEHLVGVALRRGNGPDQRLVVRAAELTRS